MITLAGAGWNPADTKAVRRLGAADGSGVGQQFRKFLGY